jgi:hypothetical protein
MKCEDALSLLRERRACAVLGETRRIKEIDEERWAHEEQNNFCPCWQIARRAADGIKAA